jgi:MtN3 and saliva related transmembrane protein
MPSLETLIGLAAAFFTTASYVPQVWKGWRTRSVGDLSLRMILILSTGIALWVAYGFLRGDRVIIGANALCLFFLANLLILKLREIFGAERRTNLLPRPGEGGRGVTG